MIENGKNDEKHGVFIESKTSSIYTVEARNDDLKTWALLVFASSIADDAYAYAKKLAKHSYEIGDEMSLYRIVKTDPDGAKIAQIVYHDKLGAPEPLNMKWIENMELEDAQRKLKTGKQEE